jgi:HTH-type transcriptional regulator / antitoxin HigA
MNIATQEALNAWSGVYNAKIRRPDSEESYEALLSFLEYLTDNFNTDLEPHHSLWVLVAEYLHDWEQSQPPVIPESTPNQILRFLLEQHHLKAKDFPEIDQSLFSKILAGKRKISKQNARLFAKRFSTVADVFL